MIARPCGSVPEVLVTGRTGFVADTFEEIVDAVKRIDTISRAECRKHVEERFTVERMVDDYEAVYARLLGTGVAG